MINEIIFLISSILIISNCVMGLSIKNKCKSGISDNKAVFTLLLVLGCILFVGALAKIWDGSRGGHTFSKSVNYGATYMCLVVLAISGIYGWIEVNSCDDWGKNEQQSKQFLQYYVSVTMLSIAGFIGVIVTQIVCKDCNAQHTCNTEIASLKNKLKKSNTKGSENVSKLKQQLDTCKGNLKAQPGKCSVQIEKIKKELTDYKKAKTEPKVKSESKEGGLFGGK